MALSLRVKDSSGINLYAGGFWTFFNGEKPCSGNCQKNAVWIENVSKFYYFGISTHLVDTLIVDNGIGTATSFNNPGGWGGVVAAYLVHQ
jgi:glucan 1,3-beta-glucosidase